jgi:hypothetical protein
MTCVNENLVHNFFEQDCAPKYSLPSFISQNVTFTVKPLLKILLQILFNTIRISFYLAGDCIALFTGSSAMCIVL